MAGFDPSASGALLPMVPAAPNPADAGIGLSQLGAGPGPVAMPDGFFGAQPLPGGPSQQTFDPMALRDLAAQQGGGGSPTGAFGMQPQVPGQYIFTEDEVNQLAAEQGADPAVVRKLLGEQGARIATPQYMAQQVEESRGKGKKAEAPAVGGQRLRAPQVGSAPAGSPGGGFRKLLNTELQKRMAERDVIAAQFGTASQEYKQATDALISLQQQAAESEAAGLSQVADEQRRTQQNVDQLRAIDGEKRVQEDEAARLQQEQIDAGWKKYREATIEDLRTPGDHLMATFGVAMAGVADAILMSQGKQGNFQEGALSQVDANVKRMVDLQLERLDRDRENLTQKERALVTFREQVGSDRAFRSFLEQKQWEDLAHLSEQVETRTKNELKHNAAQQLKALAEQAAAAANQQGMAAALADAQGRVRDLHDFGFNLSVKQAMGAGQKKPGRSGYGLKVIDPNRPPEDAEIAKAQEIVSDAAGLMTTLEQMGQMAKKGSTWSPTDRATAARRLMAMGPQLSNTFGSGAPSKEQLDETADKILNPTEANLADVEQFFDTFTSDMRSLTNARIRPYNVQVDDLDVRPE